MDYESARNALTTKLRTAGRRNRGLARVQKDAEIVYSRLAHHQCFTSALSMIEYELIHFSALKQLVAAYSVQRARDLSKFSISLLLSRVLVPSKIHVVPLTRTLTMRGSNDSRMLELRDSIHLHTAKQSKCEIIISTDDHMRRLDRRIQANGSPIRIVDTNIAKNLL